MSITECGQCSDAKQLNTIRLIPCLAISKSLFACQLCTEGDIAIKYCVDCKSFLGKSCARSHSTIIIWSNHKLLSIPIDLYCSPISTNQLYLYCDTCKILLCKKYLVRAHLSNDHDIKTLDSVYEELITHLKKVFSKCPQNIKEYLWSIEYESMGINANGRRIECAIETLYSRTSRPYETREDFVRNRSQLSKEGDFCFMYLQYLYTIKLSSQKAVKEKIVECFIEFLMNSLNQVLLCKNKDTLLLFAPMLIHSIENPEMFAWSLRNCSTQEIHERIIEHDVSALTSEIKDICSFDASSCQTFAYFKLLVHCVALIVAEQISKESISEAPFGSIIRHPTDEGNSDRTPQQEREVLENALLYRNHNCDFENVNEEN